MKYLCLGYHPPGSSAAVPEARRRQLHEERSEFDDRLRKMGGLIQSGVVQRMQDATTLRFEQGKASIARGRLVDMKQELDAMVLIEADDLNHAIRLMSDLPGVGPGGCLEILPIRQE